MASGRMAFAAVAGLSNELDPHVRDDVLAVSGYDDV
jgi:hypothetical protein